MFHETNKKHVVILGAGFGGVRVALKLAKQKTVALDIALVDKNDYHEFHADLYEVASAIFSDGKEAPNEKTAFHNLRSTAVIPLQEIFRDMGVRLVKGEVTDVAVKNHAVSVRNAATRSEETLAYDILVIALGSCTNYYGIPHLKEFALPFKNTDDALNIRNRIEESYIYKRWNERLRIVVAGGGLTGCELVGELVGYVRKLEQTYGRLPEYTELIIIEKENELLGQVPVWMRKVAYERLRNLGVLVQCAMEISEVTAQQLVLRNGKTVSYDVLVWTAGIAAQPVIQSLRGLAHNHHQCLTVTKTLRVANYTDIFALGDASYCYDATTNYAMPATAQTAVSQADVVAENVLCTLRKKNLLPYRPIKTMWLISLGGKFALASLYGFRVWGMAGWLLKRRFSYSYFNSIVPKARAWRMWFRSLQIYGRND